MRQLTMFEPLRALLAVAASLVALNFAAAPASAAPPELVEFRGWAGPPIRVFVLRPDKATDDAPVVFVMHGVKRDADRYFAEWRPYAEKYGFVLIAPEFSDADFPKSVEYNLGGVLDEDGNATPRETWAFSVIEPLFDALRIRLSLSSQQYIVYGHSAGAQFVHRYAMFGFGKRASMIIAANAGWYTFPSAGEWPYGPADLPDGVYDPVVALAAPLVVLAGEADTNARHPSLRRTPEANAQGRNRFDRALTFYAAGQELAQETGNRFNWSCVTAKGVDHDDAKAAPFAVALFLGEPPAAGAPCTRGERVK